MPENALPKTPQMRLLPFQQKSQRVLGDRNKSEISKKDKQPRLRRIPAHIVDAVLCMVKSLESTRFSRRHRLLVIDQRLRLIIHLIALPLDLIAPVEFFVINKEILGQATNLVDD